MVIVLYLLLLCFPVIAYIRLYNEQKKLNDTTNKPDLSGFEIANKIVDENVYIIEVRGTILNTYYKSRETLKFSTKVFHSSDILSTTIAAKLAYSTKKNSFLTGSLLRVLDVLNIISFICFLVGIIYDIDFIFIAIAILISSLGITIIDMINSKDTCDEAFDYLVKKKIIDKEYLYLKDIIKYEYISRVFSIIIDSFHKLIKTMFKS